MELVELGVVQSPKRGAKIRKRNVSVIKRGSPETFSTLHPDKRQITQLDNAADVHIQSVCQATEDTVEHEPF